ncbi:hypothetical protein TH25_13790 [Thalassospira profundimaris]|uniref:Uncharacterized protein n=1 Tax=Thalassospira profundimaris TaxID=502049 RepID=A0A367X514_9PROT|nr:hypothetical protein [Thalassospira profundimaris]RCK48677.1 hypothetical protein TH25_13790 [Thalassospira profundimaris]
MMQQWNLPEIVTHNYDPRRGRFQNLCDLPASDAENILQDIRQSGLTKIKRNYLDRRLRTETWLREKRQNLIGITPRNTPIYFFLGDFSDGKDISRPKSVHIQLSDFNEDMITFTYSDSMNCFEETDDTRINIPPFNGQLFTLRQLKTVVSNWGLPACYTSKNATKTTFIEMQLWDNDPICKISFD